MAAGKAARALLRNLALGVPVFVTFVDVFGYVAKVEGVSMQPSLNPDNQAADYVLLNRWTVRNFEIYRGDVVSLL